MTGFAKNTKPDWFSIVWNTNTGCVSMQIKSTSPEDHDNSPYTVDVGSQPLSSSCNCEHGCSKYETIKSYTVKKSNKNH